MRKEHLQNDSPWKTPLWLPPQLLNPGLSANRTVKLLRRGLRELPTHPPEGGCDAAVNLVYGLSELGFSTGMLRRVQLS